MGRVTLPGGSKNTREDVDRVSRITFQNRGRVVTIASQRGATQAHIIELDFPCSLLTPGARVGDLRGGR